jgi:hypothetical protein
MAKSDLVARPIFVRVKESIVAHMTVVFIAMCISKVIEISTNMSIKKIVESIWNIEDAILIDKLTGKKYRKRQPYSGLIS